MQNGGKASAHTVQTWQEMVAYRFQSLPDGEAPVAEIAFDRNGNLYGATQTVWERATVRKHLMQLDSIKSSLV